MVRRESKVFSILHVDDEPNDQLIIRRSLEKNLGFAFNLETADDAKRGIKKLQQKKFDLVLVDFKLPGMTGLEFFEELKKLKFDIDTILVTGKGSEKLAVEAMKRGLKDYLIKDDIQADPTELVQAIKNLFLESSFPQEIPPDVCRNIVELFDKSDIVKINVQPKVQSTPESPLSVSELLPALKSLAELDYLNAKPLHSTISCPSCNSLATSLILKCGECDSPQLVKGEAIEHYSCGGIDLRVNFEKEGGKLVCPKCEKEVKLIGVDYRKVGAIYVCPKQHRSSFPILTSRCENGHKFDIERAKLVTLYEYTLTEKGKNMIRLSS